MKAIKIWRIEDDECLGPYRSRHSSDSRPLMGMCTGLKVYGVIGNKSFNVRRFKRMCKNGWRFGWISEQQAIDHCNGNLDKLIDLGFTLHWILVDRYRIFPDGQVMYFK